MAILFWRPLAAGHAWGDSVWSTLDSGVAGTLAPPTSADDANFSSNDNSSCAINATANCNNLSFNNGTGWTGTLSGSGFGLNVFGNLTLSAAAMSYTFSSTLTFAATSTGKTVTSNGVTVGGSWLFSGVGGGWTLQDNLTISSSTTLQVGNGTLNTNAKTVSTGAFVSTSGTRTLTLTNSTINVTGTSGTVLNISGAGALTMTTTGSTVNVSGGTVNTGLTITLGPRNYHNFNITAAGLVTIGGGGGTFDAFSYTSTTDKRDQLILAGNDIVIAANGSLALAGNSVVNRAFIKSNTLGTQRKITVPAGATVTLTNVDVQDVFINQPLTAWGDSLTAGNEDGSGITYPNVLAGLFSPARAVTNDGVGGDTSSQILTRFQAAPSTWNTGTLIWSGRNNYSDSATVQSDIATMVADLTISNYLVLSIINGNYASEVSGQSGYNQIVSLNAALSSTYGSKYIDVRSMLVAAYNPANGADVIDHTNDVPPFSLRAIDYAGTLFGSISAGDTSFSVTQTQGALSVGNILTIGSEYIKILAISGSNITSCTRGYGGTVAAGYSSGQAYVGTDNIHLSGAGYTLIAQWVYAVISNWGVTGTSLGDALGNSGITLDASVSLTLASTGTINWSSATWTSSGAARTAPLPQDDVSLGSSSTATTLTADMPRLGRNIDSSGYLKTLSLGSIANTIFGNFTFGVNGTYTGNAGLFPQGRGAQTITSNGKSFPGSVNFQAFGGTYTFQDNFSTSATFVLTNGTINDGGFAVSAASFQGNKGFAAAISGSGAWSLSLTSGATWTVSSPLSMALWTGVIKFTGANTTNQTFAGGGLVHPTLNWSSTASTGTLTITGANTFAALQSDNTTARTIQFVNGVTQTFGPGAWQVNGKAGVAITIKSDSSGLAATLSAAGGIDPSTYLTIQDITATGGATWRDVHGIGGAGSDGNVSGNTGWTFGNINTNASITFASTLNDTSSTAAAGASISLSLVADAQPTAVRIAAAATAVFGLNSVSLIGLPSLSERAAASFDITAGVSEMDGEGDAVGFGATFGMSASVVPLGPPNANDNITLSNNHARVRTLTNLARSIP